MCVFIHTLKGKIGSISRDKKEISLCAEENVAEGTRKKELAFSLEPNARITNASCQQIKLICLKEGQKVEVGYTSDRAKKTVMFIRVLS